MPRDSLPAAAEVFAALPQPLPDDDGIRESVRAIRAADGLLLGVLDDDPTGSQAVHDVQVVTVLEEDAYEAALASPTATRSRPVRAQWMSAAVSRPASRKAGTSSTPSKPPPSISRRVAWIAATSAIT